MTIHTFSFVKVLSLREAIAGVPTATAECGVNVGLGRLTFYLPRRLWISIQVTLELYEHTSRSCRPGTL